MRCWGGLRAASEIMIGCPERPPSARRAPRRGRVAVVALAAALVWGGCSVEKHYEVLSLFFDGVPEPGSAEAAGGGSGRAGGGGGGPVSSHQAYLDRRCDTCHGDSASFGFTTSGFSDLNDTKCVECHQDSLDAHPMLHGPVAAQACLFCHRPHVSEHPSLLTDASPALCLRCHQPSQQGAPASTVHEDLTRDCLECHLGHGGRDRNYLRDGWETVSVPAPDAEPEPES